jgi:signal transduction histidine kinase
MKDVELFIVTGIIVTLLFVAFIVSFLLLNQKRHFGYLKEKQDARNKFDEMLLQSQLEIKEQTLQHIANELHDNLGQIASLIKINLNTLQLQGPDAAQKVEDTKELVKLLINDLKSLSVTLNSERITQLGIAHALENEIERLKKTGQFETQFLQEGTIPTLDPNTTIILFRMAQEIINNTVKHSSAKQVIISLKAMGNLFKLSFQDNGLGFDKEEKIRSGGSGLMNLQKRAKLIHARIFIESQQGTGTTISIELPL